MRPQPWTRLTRLILGGVLLSVTPLASTSDRYSPMMPTYPSQNGNPPPAVARDGYDYIALLQQELDRLNSQIYQLVGQRAGLLDELQQAHQQIRRLNDYVDWLSDSNQELLTRQQQLQQQLNAANQGYRNSWQQLQRLRQQLTAGQEQLSGQDARQAAELTELRQQLSERDRQIENLRSELETLKTRSPGPAPSPVQPAQEHQGMLQRLRDCLDTTTDSAACPSGRPMIIEGVSFDYDSHHLTEQSQALLRQVAAVLADHPGLDIEIAGHTDSQGNPAYNVWLSQQRAEAVRKFLIAQGIPARRLQAIGYGGTQPIADNATWEGLHKNRRVELRILKPAAAAAP